MIDPSYITALCSHTASALSSYDWNASFAMFTEDSIETVFYRKHLVLFFFFLQELCHCNIRNVRAPTVHCHKVCKNKELVLTRSNTCKASFVNYEAKYFIHLV